MKKFLIMVLGVAWLFGDDVCLNEDVRKFIAATDQEVKSQAKSKATEDISAVWSGVRCDAGKMVFAYDILADGALAFKSIPRQELKTLIKQNLIQNYCFNSEIRKVFSGAEWEYYIDGKIFIEESVIDKECKN